MEVASAAQAPAGGGGSPGGEVAEAAAAAARAVREREETGNQIPQDGGRGEVLGAGEGGSRSLGAAAGCGEGWCSSSSSRQTSRKSRAPPLACSSGRCDRSSSSSMCSQTKRKTGHQISQGGISMCGGWGRRGRGLWGGEQQQQKHQQHQQAEKEKRNWQLNHLMLQGVGVRHSLRLNTARSYFYTCLSSRPSRQTSVLWQCFFTLCCFVLCRPKFMPSWSAYGAMPN